jgi:hypothetical protein
MALATAALTFEEAHFDSTWPGRRQRRAFPPGDRDIACSAGSADSCDRPRHRCCSPLLSVNRARQGLHLRERSHAYSDDTGVPCADAARSGPGKGSVSSPAATLAILLDERQKSEESEVSRSEVTALPHFAAGRRPQANGARQRFDGPGRTRLTAASRR